MKHTPFSRRCFLNASVAAGAITAAVPLTSLSEAAAATSIATKTLTEHAAQTLLAMSRHIAPHSFLGDQYYAKVVTALDEQAGADAALKANIDDGIAGMDAVHGLPWRELSRGAQYAILKSIEGSDFFGTVRTATIGNLYTNPLAYRYFGDEGSSVEHGGYIDRGFDDIGWLPKE